MVHLTSFGVAHDIDLVTDFKGNRINESEGVSVRLAFCQNTRKKMIEKKGPHVNIPTATTFTGYRDYNMFDGELP